MTREEKIVLICGSLWALAIALGPFLLVDMWGRL